VTVRIFFGPGGAAGMAAVAVETAGTAAGGEA
jgi:hypothetical protein